MGGATARIAVRLLAALVSVIPGLQSVASAQSAVERTRTALVLSGGGARGAAHVGVLEVLEANGVAVDCVVGTSMGSIVGGLYAAGWSPEAMAAELVSTDWEDAFDDSPARKQTSFRRKQDDFLPLFPLELGLGRGGFKAPSGLIAGQKLGFLLKSLTAHIATMRDFDRLGLPYRAVAADLDDGSVVVLRSGSLAEAMRASMSIPGVFRPVELDGRTLVDGGIARNLPVDIGRELCASGAGDRVIAVDIGTPRRQSKEGGTFVNVLAQTFSVINKRNVAVSLAELGEGDLLITPDLGDISASSFDRVAEAIEIGRQAAEEVAAELQRFASPPEAFSSWVGGVRKRFGEVEEIRIAEVAVEGAERVDPRQILRRIRLGTGDLIRVDQLGTTLGRIYQLGEFEQVDFRFEEVTGGTRLVIDVKEKSWGPGYLRTGLRLESNLEGDSDFLAIANYRRSQINSLGAEWRTNLTIGDENSLFTEFFQPFDHRGFTFVAPYFEASRDEFVDPSGEFGGIDVSSYEVGVAVGTQFGNYGEVRFTASSGQVSAGSTTVRGLGTFDVGGFGANLLLDRLDETEFPRRGSFLAASYFDSNDFLGVDDEYQVATLTTFLAHPIRRRTTAIFGLDLGAEMSGELPIYAEFRLGGFFNLSGLRPQSLSGDTLALATIGGYHQFRNKFYLGAALEAGNVWRDRADADVDDLIQSGMVYVGRQTFVGPLYVGYASTTDGDDSWYFFLGRAFD
ncbi:MAG: patatin-like phospholipase family protein [Acidobacteriota bacterium]